MKELIRSELNIFKSEISKEMKIMSNKISETSEENLNLKIRVDQLENQPRANNVVIHGLLEVSFYSDDGGELNSPIAIVEEFDKHFSKLGKENHYSIQIFP